MGMVQEDLQFFEAREDQGLEEEEFYGGGGQVKHGLEHFPRLWCPNGTYSVVGQVRAPQHYYLCYLAVCGIYCLIKSPYH